MVAFLDQYPSLGRHCLLASNPYRLGLFHWMLCLFALDWPWRTDHGVLGYIEKDSADKSTLLRSESLMEKDPDQEDPDIDETKQKEPESPELALTGDEALSPVASMLLLKILQLEISDVRATYLVGVVMSKQGRLGHARQIMRRVAPIGSIGFPPAHAWLAADRIQTWV